jgi:hypothetical protein
MHKTRAQEHETSTKTLPCKQVATMLKIPVSLTFLSQFFRLVLGTADPVKIKPIWNIKSRKTLTLSPVFSNAWTKVKAA